LRNVLTCLEFLKPRERDCHLTRLSL
jgi:hypothetical protein